MWKSGWNLDREWVKRNEKWLILLVLGLAILILYAPFGKKTSETGVWQSGERWAESGTGTNSGNRAGQDKNGSSEESDSDVETGLPGTASRQDANRLYELRLEQRIRDVLKKVDGVGEVDVMLTLFSSSEKVLRVDKERSRSATSETDSSGGTRQQADESLRESTVLAGSSGSGEPVVEKELAPEISGIVISAQGGGNASVQKEISEAMQALFGLPAHKISIKAGGIKEYANMRMKMKRVFRRNQIIITTLAIMIAAAGYLNYAGKSDLPGADTYEAGATKISDSDIYSENQAVSGSVADGEYEEIASLDDPGEGDPLAAGSEEGTAQGAADGEEASADNPAVDNPGEAVLTGGTGVAEYIANVQLSREQIRAKSREALNALINNENLDASAKEAAVQDMLALNAIAEKENAAETLLMAKGFADPVVSITDGKVDVVVNAPSITDPQRAQIEDIVKRKTEISAENIVISLLNLGD